MTLSTDDRRAQALAALAKADEVRLPRAAVKRALKARRTTIEVVLADPPACVLSAKIAELLLVVPRVGRVRMEATLRRCGVSPTARVEALDADKRAEIVQELLGAGARRVAVGSR